MQNLYDSDEFFEGYAQLERSVRGLDGAVEWPLMRARAGDLTGRRVLDLGCGYGWFCRFARENGASQVIGMDVSEKMLARAASQTDDRAITYTLADLNDVALPPASFDLVYSSLAFHYLTRLDRLMAQISGTLVPGGRLVFSVEHPIFTSPIEPEWLVTPNGRRVWALDGYQQEGPRTTDWIVSGVIKQHRTLATYFQLLLSNGFIITAVEEWSPTEEQLAADPTRSEALARPPFLLVAAWK